MNRRRHRLCEQVAQATGEAYGRIARMGFSPLRQQLPEEPESYAAPQTVDWDQVQQERQVAWYPAG
jgi:hypothetical protein